MLYLEEERIKGKLMRLCHGRLVHCAKNASYESLFAAFKIHNCNLFQSSSSLSIRASFSVCCVINPF